MGEPIITPEMVRAALSSIAVDDEGSYPSLCEHLDYSGGNKARAVAHAALRSALAVAPPPHPLVALLAEALAVTDPERPPHEVQLCLDSSPDDGVSLVWHHDDRADTAIEYANSKWRLWSGKSPLTTSDPAEARAWLAAALEAT